MAWQPRAGGGGAGAVASGGAGRHRRGGDAYMAGPYDRDGHARQRLQPLRGAKGGRGDFLHARPAAAGSRRAVGGGNAAGDSAATPDPHREEVATSYDNVMTSSTDPLLTPS
eukprot:1180421-Prorocentrum_minimum.AAC.1